MRSRIARAVGEGALAGWVSGAALASWEILLNQDFAQGMLRLAAGRLVLPALAGALLGILASTAAEILLILAERKGRRGAFLGIALLGLAYSAAVVLAAGPFRQSLFPLKNFSSKALSIGMFAVIAGAPGAMLLGRFRGALDGTAGGGAGGGRVGRPGPRARAAWCGVLLLALTASLGWALPWIPSGHPGNGLSVILVSLDTLRADRVGVLGCPRPLTPILDDLAREGTLFDQAEAAAPWTLPSHASLFSSLLPYDHGARWEHRPLSPSIITLAEHFREAGFRTASFNGGGYISAFLGLSQGFEIYEEHDEQKEGGPESIAAAALKWVRGVGKAPFFLFVHTYEIHSPYTHGEFADPSDAGRLSGTFETRDVLAVQRGEMVLTASERRYVSGLYDGDVAHADRVIVGLLQTLEKEGILDRVLLVVLSDHGEDLWDHDATRSPGHGHSLYEEMQRVPLVFRAPGVVRDGARIRTPVSLLDVAPTVLALSGLPPDPRYRGRSLEAALRTGSEPDPAPILAESTEYGPDRFSLREGDLKVILTPAPEQANAGVHVGARPLEVFDLASDPMEKRNLSRAMPPEAAKMLEVLWRRVERVFRPARGKEGIQKLPEELREQLRSLGYVQ